MPSATDAFLGQSGINLFCVVLFLSKSASVYFMTVFQIITFDDWKGMLVLLRCLISVTLFPRKSVYSMPSIPQWDSIHYTTISLCQPWKNSIQWWISVGLVYEGACCYQDCCL